MRSSLKGVLGLGNLKVEQEHNQWKGEEGVAVASLSGRREGQQSGGQEGEDCEERGGGEGGLWAPLSDAPTGEGSMERVGLRGENGQRGGSAARAWVTGAPS